MGVIDTTRYTPTQFVTCAWSDNTRRSLHVVSILTIAIAAPRLRDRLPLISELCTEGYVVSRLPYRSYEVTHAYGYRNAIVMKDLAATNQQLSPTSVQRDTAMRVLLRSRSHDVACKGVRSRCCSKMRPRTPEESGLHPLIYSRALQMWVSRERQKVLGGYLTKKT